VGKIGVKMGEKGRKNREGRALVVGGGRIDEGGIGVGREKRQEG